MTLPPDLLIEYFDLLLERAATLRTHLASRDAPGARVCVHQIAGTGAAYGYPELTSRGRTLERRLALGALDDAEVAAFAELCEAVARDGLRRVEGT